MFKGVRAEALTYMLILRKLNLFDKGHQGESIKLECGAFGYLGDGERIGQYLVADVGLVLLDGGIAILVA